MTRITVAAHDVCFNYANRQILYNVSLHVPSGGICALLGPSGDGKTTFIRCILGICFALRHHCVTRVAGLLKPTSGTIRVLGGTPAPSRAIGYMPQDYSLYETFTVQETLLYFGAVSDVKADLLEQRVSDAISTTDLGQFRGQLVSTLSGGQKRRLSLAVAMIHVPRLLVLDEPTVGLDPALRQKYLFQLDYVIA